MRERFRALDRNLLLAVLALIALGTLTLFSAGRNTPQANIWLKQSLWNGLGLVLMLVLTTTDPRRPSATASPPTCWAWWPWRRCWWWAGRSAARPAGS